MLDSIKIPKVASYETEQHLTDLRKVNFIFGSNGAGKTTISRIIANPDEFLGSTVWQSGTPLSAMVYNRDFVQSNFNESKQLKGVFTLGEGVGIQEQIEKAKSEQTKLVASIGALTSRLEGDGDNKGKNAERADLEDELKRACWKTKTKYDAQLAKMIEGSRSSQEKFKDKILAEATTNTAQLHTPEYLDDKSKTVFGSTPDTVDPLYELNFESINQLNNHPILAKPIIGKGDVDIAAMIRKLGNSDWVQHGRHFYNNNQGACPFCQQAAPSSLADSLNEYFDETYKKDSDTIKALQSGYSLEASRINHMINDILSYNWRFVDNNGLRTEGQIFEALVQSNFEKIQAKLKEPSQIVELAPLHDIQTKLTLLIKDANIKIAEHNRMVANIATERKTLTSQAWKFLTTELEPTLTTYMKSRTEIEQTIASITNARDTARSQLSAKTKEIEALERQATSIQPTMDNINRLLDSFGFRSFKLDRADDSVSYKLVRADGTDARMTLSEGEKTFVTFLYFYNLLSGSNATDGITRNRIVVFDDPVSSLDSDVLFIVSTLIKKIYNDAEQGNGYVKQVFVLTHNVYFHKEVSYRKRPPTRKGEKKAKSKSETFWTIKKTDAGSIVERHKGNPISTTYKLLWSEIASGSTSITLSNTMRRILEHYFKTLGGIDLDKLADSFEGSDKMVCNSLISWAHDGSHHVGDELHVTPHGTTVDTYKRVFEQIFNNTGHDAHYLMMMDLDEDSAEAEDSNESQALKAA